ncbi:hypothetical protein [Anabaena sphaerica]|nr:hypothetical protein [Anabaena sphaerica]
MQNPSKFCFSTLALGKNYRALALELAKDLAQFAPNIPFVILTDNPQDFQEMSNVLAFPHQQQSIGCYHDKLFVIEKGLSLFNSCIFMDADMRILAPITDALNWQPGITAKIAWHNIVKHNKNPREIEIFQKVAQKFNLQLEDITFVHECLFVVTRDEGREIDFIETWKRMAAYCELNKYYRGEGHSIGLAAAKSGLKIRTDSMEYISFFKDKLEWQKIKNGETDIQEKSVYIQRQKELEYPQISLFERVIKKLFKIIMYLYRSIKLKIYSLTDIRFFYG